MLSGEALPWATALASSLEAALTSSELGRGTATNISQATNLAKPYERLLKQYAPNYPFLLLPLAVILLVAAAAITWRAINSWAHGLTSGSYLSPFAIALGCFWNAGEFSLRRALTALGGSCIALVVGFALRLRAAVARERTVDRGATKLFAATGPSYSSATLTHRSTRGKKIAQPLSLRRNARSQHSHLETTSNHAACLLRRWQEFGLEASSSRNWSESHCRPV